MICIVMFIGMLFFSECLILFLQHNANKVIILTGGHLVWHVKTIGFKQVSLMDFALIF